MTNKFIEVLPDGGELPSLGTEISLNHNDYSTGITDQSYSYLLLAIDSHFNTLIREGEVLLSVDVAGSDIFSLFIELLNNHYGEEIAKSYTCKKCHSWFTKFANIVTVDDEGILNNTLWNAPNVPEAWQVICNEMHHRIITTARVINTAYALGTNQHNIPRTALGTAAIFNESKYPHFYLTVPVGSEPNLVSQGGAARRYIKANTIYNRISPRTFDVVGYMINNDLFTNTTDDVIETLKEIVSFGRMYHNDNLPFANRNNLIWKYIAGNTTTFIDFTHKGHNLGDVFVAAENKSDDYGYISNKLVECFDAVAAKALQDKRYREQVDQARDLFYQLGLTKQHLDFRPAVITDFDLLWSGTKKETIDLFADNINESIDELKKDNQAAILAMKPIEISFTQFRDTVLPTASDIYLHTFAQKEQCNAVAFITSMNKEGSLFHYNNPLSAFCINLRDPLAYSNRAISHPMDHWMKERNFARVSGLTYSPADQCKYEPDNKIAFWLIEDMFPKEEYILGIPFIPDTYRKELHPVLDVIRHHCDDNKLSPILYNTKPVSGFGINLGQIIGVYVNGEFASSYVIVEW